MPNFPSYQKIVTSALIGVNTAFKKYYKWSNGLWLCDAPESFIVGEIANSLSNIVPVPIITLETTIQDLYVYSDAELRGPKPRNSPSGHMDITVWWAKDQPRIPIEVKKCWRVDALKEDAKRLQQMINKKSTMKQGLLVAYTSAKKPETIDNLFNKMAYKTGTTLESRIGLKKKSNDGWYWDAGCFSVKP